jgi:hypothetical protein
VNRADFRDAPGALGDHHEVDDHEDSEHHHTDHVVAADDHLTEGLDHFTGGCVAFLAVEHDHPGGGDVQGQAQQGGDQEDGRENGEVQRAHGVDADQQHDDRQGDVEGEEYIEEEGRDRQHHHCQHDQQQ